MPELHETVAEVIMDADRAVHNLARLPDGGDGHMTMKLGRDYLAWYWSDGIVGCSRGPVKLFAMWAACRQMRQRLAARSK